MSCGRRTAFVGHGEEVMAVEILAADGDEELAFAERARIGGNALEARLVVAARAARAHGGDGFGKAHHRLPRRASAAPATAASENGRRSIPIS